MNPPEHQGGVGEGDDDVGVKLVADLRQGGVADNRQMRSRSRAGQGISRASLPACMPRTCYKQWYLPYTQSGPRLTAFLMVHTAVGLPGSGDTAISAAGTEK